MNDSTRKDVKLSDSMSWNIFFLNLSGFFPIDSRKYSKRQFVAYIFYSIYVQSFYVVLQIAEITYMIQHWDDTEMVLKMLPKILEESQSMMQAAIFWTNAHRIRRLIEMLDEQGWNGTSEYALSLIKSIPLGSIVFALQPLLNGILWILYPYLDTSDEFQLPLDLWLPDSWKDPPHIHWVLWFEVIVVSVEGMGQTLVNTTICALIAHANAQLKTLRYSIEKIGRKQRTKDDDSSELMKYKKNCLNYTEQRARTIEMKMEFVKCMEHYELILGYVREVESIFTWTMFTRFAMSGIIICSAILQITLASTGSVEFLFSIVFAIGMLNELAIFCYFGDVLILESSMISEAVYNCDWISTDVSFKRIILIFMMRTNQPIIICAGKFFQLSIQSLVNVLKTSYTYYAVLRSFKTK